LPLQTTKAENVNILVHGVRLWTFGAIDVSSLTLVRSLASNERSTLFVVEKTARATVGEQTVDALDDPEGAEGGEDQRGDGDEARSSGTALVSVDTEEGPGDGDGASEITFRRGEGVGG